MTTKVEVIEVDLGEGIEEIISGDLTRLSEEDVQRINEAVTESASEVKSTPTNLVLEKICNMLEEATKSNRWLTIDELIAVSSPHITNPSGLITRIKNYLHSRGNTYVIRKRKRDGKSAYDLIPYNTEE